MHRRTLCIWERRKGMKKALRSQLSIFKHAEAWICTAAICFLLLFAILEVRLHMRVTTLPRSVLLRIILLTLICLLFYLSGMLYAGRTGNRRIYRRLIVFFFFLYLYLLLNVTLFEKGFGRDALLENGENTRAYYLQNFVNLIPFHSIGEVYIMGLAHGYVSPYYVLLNLFGNLCVFMPISFFLPMLFKAQKKWYVFLPTLILSVVCVELVQFCFMVGSCDVDDVILNVSGALLLYFLLRLPSLSALCERIGGVKSE